VRFSLWPTTSQSWTDLADVADHAARTGWDGLWIADHFMSAAPPGDGPMLECWTVLAGLALTTSRLRLGSLVTGNTYRHPAVLANMVATVDHLSGGRAVLGLGAGWQENEHRAYGIELPGVADRLSRLDEACAIVRSLLDEPRTTFEGRHFQISEAPLEPKPLQRHLPLLVGGGGERVILGIVARRADEWNCWGTPEVIARKSAVLAKHCDAVGRDPGTISRSAQVLVDLGGAPPTRRGMPLVAGTAAEIQELLHRYAEIGLDEFILPDWNLGTGSARADTLDRFLEEVAAPLRPRS
jgi:F420-dependent oxidoreductase-like protein